MEKEAFHVEVCSECHPFYTGKQKIVDSTGRVDKFNQKFGNMFKRYFYGLSKNAVLLTNTVFFVYNNKRFQVETFAQKISSFCV